MTKVVENYMLKHVLGSGSYGNVFVFYLCLLMFSFFCLFSDGLALISASQRVHSRAFDYRYVDACPPCTPRVPSAPRAPRALPGSSFLPFERARTYVRALKLKSQKEWVEWRKSDQRPVGIPSNPHTMYRDDGWVSMPDWLG